MKSLEIVSEMLEDGLEVDDFNVKIASRQLRIIKQDLEILEIIRKKDVSMLGLKQTLYGFYAGIYKRMEEVLFDYNIYHTIKDGLHLTMEELLKLKQWLEENENE